MKDGALAGTRRADDGDPFTPAHVERHAVKHQTCRPRRIGKADVRKADFAARRRWQSNRPRRRHDCRRYAQNLEQPLGRAGGLRQLAPHFRQLAEAGGGEHGVEHELGEPPGAHTAGEHVLRADPQHDDHAREDEEDCDRGEDCPRPDRMTRGEEGALNCGAEPALGQRLVGKGLQHAHRADQLGRIGRGIGERILGRARAPAHRPAEAVERQHDDW